MLDMMTIDYILYNQWYRLTFVNIIQIKKAFRFFVNFLFFFFFFSKPSYG